MLTKGISELVDFIFGRMKRMVFEHNCIASIESAMVNHHANIHAGKGDSGSAKRTKDAKELLMHPYFKLVSRG